MSDKSCELCAGTGWYGDNGAGIRGNKEYVPCERCRNTTSEAEIVERKIDTLRRELDAANKRLAFFEQGTG